MAGFRNSSVFGYFSYNLFLMSFSSDIYVVNIICNVHKCKCLLIFPFSISLQKDFWSCYSLL